MDTVLKLSQVVKEYSDFKLSNITFEINKGRIVGLVGENGAGKTTLISLILNQINLDGGSIELFGENILKNSSETKQKIGFYIDECCFHPCFTAKNINNIMKSIYKKWDKKQYFEYLSQFNVPINKKIEALSKGTKSKLMLAVSMAYHPSLLIFDEITSGLDPIMRNNVIKIVKNYVETTGATVFFSTHITSDLEDFAHDIMFLHKGQMVFHKNLDDLQENHVIYRCSLETYHDIPKHEIQRVLFSNGSCYLLASNKSSLKNKLDIHKIPNVEDFMHMYIEGKCADDRIIEKGFFADI